MVNESHHDPLHSVALLVALDLVGWNEMGQTAAWLSKSFLAHLAFLSKGLSIERALHHAPAGGIVYLRRERASPDCLVSRFFCILPTTPLH